MELMRLTVAEIDTLKCCGCSACSQICPKNCIVMQSNSEGFLFPVINEEVCIKCGRCYDVCPTHKFIKFNPLKIIAAKAKNKVLQQESSSGGAFTVIAMWAIRNGYTVYGSVYSKDFTKVYHKSTCSIDDLWEFRGSKYVQSDIGTTYLEVKNDLMYGKKILFSGTPCQIQGLRNFLGKDYSNLITIDILCHGVPSPLLYNDYITCIIRKYGTILSLNMKDKTEGWKKQQIRFGFEKYSKISYDGVENLWSKIFYSGVALRPSCYRCSFACLERCGDISLGDCWGIEKYYPDFYDKDGVSLMLINTFKGIQLADLLKNFLEYKIMDSSECLQPILIHPTEEPRWRSFFWEKYYKFGFEYVIYYFWKLSFCNILWLKFKQSLNKFHELFIK